jgi:selenocysteine-specific elongation factor
MSPGEEALAQVTLDRPIGALHGDHFVFRDNSARRTMGGGMVIDPWPPQRGRRRPQRLWALAALADKDPRRALLQFVSGDPGWIDLNCFELARNLTPAEAAELWRTRDLVRVGAGDAFFGFRHQNWQSLLDRVQAVLALHHQAAPSAPGLEEGRLRAALDLQLPVDVFSAAIGAMARDGTIQRDGPWLKLAGHAARLTPADQRLWERIRRVMERASFNPPRVRDFAALFEEREEEVRRLMRRLARMGRLVEIAQDHFYDRARVADLARVAHHLMRENPDGKITAAAFRDRIGTGRKLAIQILEFFDRTGITAREGDLRRIREDRLAMFGIREVIPE